ncbi:MULTISPECIES: VOC family protein [Paenibacillus]|uniref:VOC family protein n=1 Tax=Paenibacillus TaxID=44249 RepID=UPI0027D904EF|nr:MULTISPECIES: VOC family protein [unclassified Paenibacillus]
MKIGINGLAHVAIQAEDYKKTLLFYQEVLGFRIGHQWSLPDFHIEHACMLISPDQRTCIELFDTGAVIPAQGERAQSRDEVRYGAMLHFAFYVDDVEAIYQQSLAYGASPYIKPAHLVLGHPELVVHNAVIQSPNGEVIEFLEEVSFDVNAIS